MDNRDFFNLLFDKGELINCARDIKDTRVCPVFKGQTFGDCEFFCINPLASEDRKPTRPNHKRENPSASLLNHYG